MSDRPPVFVHLLPSLMPPGCLTGSTAVVIDVLRATTVMIQALASGCSSIVPCLEIDEARQIYGRLPAGTAILGGERGGRPIPGFDLGNSPADYTNDRCQGRTLVMTTTNGTRAIRACQEAEQVYVAGFTNLAAVARRLELVLDGPNPQPVHLVCAGTGGEVSWEDTLVAGSILRSISYFHGHYTAMGNDAARLAEQAAPRNFSDLAEKLKQGTGGRNVIEIGLEKDIHDCSQVDRHPILAAWHKSPVPGVISVEA